MIKYVIITACLLFSIGCQPGTTFTTHEECVEEIKWDQKKGLVKSAEVSWEVKWKP